MSTEYVIDNYKTKQYLYTNRCFAAIKPEHLVANKETIEKNLLEHLSFRSDCPKLYSEKYCKWAADILSNFVGSAAIEDIDIHDDTWFIEDHIWLSDIDFYMSENALDKWIKIEVIKEQIAKKIREGLKEFIGEPNTKEIQRAVFIKIEEILEYIRLVGVDNKNGKRRKSY